MTKQIQCLLGGGTDYKGTAGYFGGDENVHKLDRGYDFMHVYSCQNSKIVPLSMCNLLHINYTSIFVLKHL